MSPLHGNPLLFSGQRAAPPTKGPLGRLCAHGPRHGEWTAGLCCLGGPPDTGHSWVTLGGDSKDPPDTGPAAHSNAAKPWVAGTHAPLCRYQGGSGHDQEDEAPGEGRARVPTLPSDPIPAVQEATLTSGQSWAAPPASQATHTLAVPFPSYLTSHIGLSSKEKQGGAALAPGPQAEAGPCVPWPPQVSWDPANPWAPPGGAQPVPH